VLKTDRLGTPEWRSISVIKKGSGLITTSPEGFGYPVRLAGGGFPMPRKLVAVDHLSLADLERRNRAAGDTTESVWEAMRRSGFRPRVPRPREERADAEAQAAVDAVRAAHPGAEIWVWAQDEHRLGLLPAVRPTTGQTWWCLLPTVKGPRWQEFARDEGIDADHRAALVLDNADWHHAKTLAIPEGIDPVFLPPSSPELQPAERLRGLVDEAVANQNLPGLTAMEARPAYRCRCLRAQRRTK
jgi:hypothetical protein